MLDCMTFLAKGLPKFDKGQTCSSFSCMQSICNKKCLVDRHFEATL